MNVYDEDILIGYICGALEDDEAAATAQRLRNDAEWNRQYKRLLSTFRPALAVREQQARDMVPPVGLAERTIAFLRQNAPVPSRILVLPDGREEFAGNDSFSSAAVEDISTQDTIVNALQETQAIRSGEVVSRPAPSERDGVPEVVVEHAAAKDAFCWRWVDAVVAASLLGVVCLALFEAVLFARHESRVAVCQNNMREIGRALQQYANLHNGDLPSVRSATRSECRVAGIYGPILMELKAILPQHLCCPDVTRATHDKIPAFSELFDMDAAALRLQRSRWGGDYAFNVGHKKEGVFYAPSLANREVHPLLADAPSGDASSLATPAHGDNGYNVLYSDGHLRFQKEMEYFGDNIFLNANHQFAIGETDDDIVLGSSTMEID
ncbi:MAG: hypothetical protein Q4D98_02240 [Planctomycetia bacterium]|nr:hypothetical protein [Planctomycetia bacterium]